MNSGNTMRLRTGLQVLAAVLISASALPAGAAEQELVGGWEGGSSRGYLFVSPSYSFTLNQRYLFVLQTTGSYLYYALPERGGMTEVTSPGGSVSVALRLRTPRLTFTAGPGFEARRTRRVLPEDREVEETETGFNLFSNLYFQATPLVAAYAIASYGDANEYTWTRVGLKRQISNTDFSRPTAIGLGGELTVQGNDDIRVYQAGGVLELLFLRATGSLQLRAGYSRREFPDGASESRPYLGLGFYRSF